MDVDSLIEYLIKLRDEDWSWLRNNRCKRLSVAIDTRQPDNVLVFDRDGKPITVEELLYQYGGQENG